MSRLKVSRILHAGYVLEHASVRILFDPIFENPFSRNCYAFPSVEFVRDEIQHLDFAAVFISHFHDDHCSLESLNLLDRKMPIYLFCQHEELFTMIRELGFQSVVALEIDVAVQAGPFEVTPRRALDADVDSILQVQVGGLRLLNVVDSWIDDETLRLLVGQGLWDMILWPFQTMREIEVLDPRRAAPAPRTLPPEWIEQLTELNPRYVVPSSCQFRLESWSWYNEAFFPISYRQFQDEIQSISAQIQVVRMDPSASVTLTPTSLERAEPLPWIKPVGAQNLDYAYDPDIKSPTTREIARRFSALSAEQARSVHDYCKSGLLNKYRSMDPPLDDYFKKPRIWQLCLYDHLGHVFPYQYAIDGTEIQLLPGDPGNRGWLTEIPMAKVYAALELGESLTSMYLRVNDADFPLEMETEIKAADILEDPLIRCLFNGEFGAYQRAQLSRLRVGEAFAKKEEPKPCPIAKS